MNLMTSGHSRVSFKSWLVERAITSKSRKSIFRYNSHFTFFLIRSEKKRKRNEIKYVLERLPLTVPCV